MIKNANSVSGGAMPAIRPALDASDRRQFIGGSDARIIMGKERKSAAASLARKAR